MDVPGALVYINILVLVPNYIQPGRQTQESQLGIEGSDTLMSTVHRQVPSGHVRSNKIILNKNK